MPDVVPTPHAVADTADTLQAWRDRLIEATADAPPTIRDTVAAYVVETQPYRRAQFLPYMLEQCLRYVGVVMAADFLASAPSATARPGGSRIASALAVLFQPSLGSWDNLLHAFAKGIAFEARCADGYRPFVIEFAAVHTAIQQLRRRPALNHHTLKDELRSPLPALLAFRNAMAHAPSPLSDADAARCEALYLPCLNDIVEAFGPIFAGYSLRLCLWSSPGSSSLLDVELRDLDPGADSDLLTVNLVRGRCDDGGLVLLRHADELPPQALAIPYFFWSASAGDLAAPAVGETLAVFDGIGSRDVIYTGSRRKHQDPLHQRSILHLLEANQVSTRVELRRFSIETLSRVMNDRSRATLDAAITDGALASPQAGYVPRRIDRELRDFLAGDRRVMFVVAEAGAGKTSFCARLVESLLPDGDAGPDNADNGVFFVRGKELRAEHCVNGTPVFAALSQECLRAGEFEGIIDLLAQIQARNADNAWRMHLVVDAVNEASCPASVLAELTALLKHARGTSWLKIVVTIRRQALSFLRDCGEPAAAFGRVGGVAGGSLAAAPDPAFHAYEHEARVSSEVPLTRFTRRELELALSRADVTGAAMVDLFAHDSSFVDCLCLPLNLRMYLELLRNAPGCRPRDEDDLFASYHALWIGGTENAPSTSSAYLSALLDRMLEAHTGTLDADAARALAERFDSPLLPEITPLQRLLDAGLLVHARHRGGGATIGFALQKQFEFELARHLGELEGHDAAAQADALVDALHRPGFAELLAARQRQLARAGVDAFLHAALPRLARSLESGALTAGMLSAALGPILRALARRPECDAECLSTLADALGRLGIADVLIDVVHELLHGARAPLAGALGAALQRQPLPSAARVDLWRACALIATTGGDFDAAADLLRQAREQPACDGVTALLIDIEALKYLRQDGRLDQAEIAIERALDAAMRVDAAPASRDTALAALDEQRALCLAARATAEPDAARRHALLERALARSTHAAERASAVGAHELHVYCCIGRAARLQELDRLEEAEHAFHEAADAANLRGMFDLYLDTQNGLARNAIARARRATDAEARRKAYADARLHAEPTLRYWRASGFVRGQLVLESYLLEAASGLGETVRAQAHREAAAALLERVGETRLRAIYDDALAYAEGFR